MPMLMSLLMGNGLIARVVCFPFRSLFYFFVRSEYRSSWLLDIWSCLTAILCLFPACTHTYIPLCCSDPVCHVHDIIAFHILLIEYSGVRNRRYSVLPSFPLPHLLLLLNFPFPTSIFLRQKWNNNLPTHTREQEIRYSTDADMYKGNNIFEPPQATNSAEGGASEEGKKDGTKKEEGK